MSKYNSCSQCLKHAVEYWRAYCQKAEINVSAYTDEEIFNVVEYWHGRDPLEPQDAVEEDLASGIKR